MKFHLTKPNRKKKKDPPRIITGRIHNLHINNVRCVKKAKNS